MKAAPPAGGGGRSGSGSKSLAERVGRVEWEQETIHKRLNEGAETFSKIHQSQKDLHEQLQEARKPLPTPWWKIVGLAVTFFAMITAWVWYAAKYPDRSEFDRARQQTDNRAKSLERDLQQLKLEQVQIQSGVKSIKESQARTEKHVDEIKKDLKSMMTPRRRRRR